MAVFRRREISPGPFKNYADYRPYVQEDFSGCCAYCLVSELLGGGPGQYELDHFRPKSLFDSLINDFYNLYYSCRTCNLAKGNRWPSSALESQGYGFLDLCSESFSGHFEEQEDGFWKPLSLRAEYTSERLRLNSPHLVEIRGMLRRLAVEKGCPVIDWDVPSREQIRQLLPWPG